MGPGDRKDRAGRVVLLAAEMLRDSFGLAERAAYISACVSTGKLIYGRDTGLGFIMCVFL
jgi:hypothetical protein